MSQIVRYLNPRAFDNLRGDFNFLVEKVNKSGGELDLQLRENYFNLYYQGNSLAKVSLSRKPYKVEINKSFCAPKVVLKDPRKRFSSDRFKRSGDYHIIKLQPKELPIFFQEKILKDFERKIRMVNYGEEIAFEQSIITDNIDRSDLIFIDRQVTGGEIPGRIDLLSLKKSKGDKYFFLIIEVKLGNNMELKGDVIDQLEGYIKAISSNIGSFRDCYKRNYRQKRTLGLLPQPGLPDNIEITDKVDGRIVVGSYFAIGKKLLENLKKNYPEWSNKIISKWLSLNEI